MLKYSSTWECFADWYINLGGFVIDERSNHFGWVTELGLLDIIDCGLDVKYSFIDWKKNGKNSFGKHNPIGQKFRNSQITMIYHFDPEMLCCHPMKLYGAFLYNHAAKKFKTGCDWHCHGGDSKDPEPQGDEKEHGSHGSHGSDDCDKHDKKASAWYVGLRIGEVVECGDWAFDLQYQYVQAQAVPDGDVNGIGRGNVQDERLTSHGRGNANYKGWRAEFLYGITDNLSVDTTFETSREINREIGGKHHYSKFQMEAIYAF